ncbi:MAG: cytochrome C, partial [Nitrosospira sp.]|nr:cytochrome C [Nitrosospira sp.]
NLVHTEAPETDLNESRKQGKLVLKEDEDDEDEDDDDDDEDEG